MQAEILAFGTEILMGEIVDTNSSYMARRLPSFGIETRFISIVGDKMEYLVNALKRGVERSDIIFVTGGLGPTEDDLTREAISEVFGEKMEIDQELLANLEEFFRARGGAGTMPESNRKQATRIPSVTILSNPRGTAPGWWAEKQNKIIVAMPGVPNELERMWEFEVSPRLQERSRGNIILARTLKTFGLSESAAGDRVKHLFGKDNPYLGIYARQDGIHFRIIAQGKTSAEAEEILRPVEKEIIEALGESVWGVDNETMEERLGKILLDRHLSLGVMESCTGGLLASSITDVPGSSEYFRGGVIAYVNDAKSTYGVDPQIILDHGAVSAEVAEAMANAARATLNSDIGIGITGIAGELAVNGIEPGTVFISTSSMGRTECSKSRFPPNRPLVKRRAVTQALLQAYSLVQAQTPTD